MKKVTYSSIGFLSLSLLLLLGCGKEFLDRTPPGNLVVSTFYKTEDDFRKGMFTVYSALQDMNDDKSDTYTNFYLVPDDDVTLQNSTTDNQDNFNWNTADNPTDNQYRNNYAGIVRATRIIEQAPNSSMSDDLKKRYIAEAKFIRAFFYFNLVTTFGEVPLVTREITTFDELKIAKSPIPAVYDFIESDLADAEMNLPPSWPDSDKGRVTQLSAKALLGKVHLYQREYPQAADKLDDIVGQRSLVKFEENFLATSENNNESLFEIQYCFDCGGNNTWASDFGGAAENTFRNVRWGGSNGNCGWNSYVATNDLATQYEPEDTVRRKGSIFSAGDDHFGEPYDPDWSNTTDHHIRKYIYQPNCEDATNGTYGGNNERVIRYADVLLMLAEALNEQGQPDAAAQYVNQVRARANLSPISSATPPAAQYLMAGAQVGTPQQNMRAHIMHERRVELAFEGHRYRDLVRWDDAGFINMDQVMEKAGKAGWQARNKFRPIPLTEIDRNAGILVQNPNY